MNLQSLLSGFQGMGGDAPMGDDMPLPDTSEQIYISSLALLKMLKHGRDGIPMEVMGLMLGEFVDDYTIKCVDVFAMPQSGNSVSVEAVDPVFQSRMLDMLKQTDRHEMVVGWYHSHPGYGPWLSGVDINTQQSFEQLNPKAVAVVVDPVQSVKGKVVIDAFRLINPQIIMMGNEPRQTTSNLEQMNPPSIVFKALVHGLNKHYYSIAINYRKNELEQDMLLNLFKKKWSYGLTLENMDVLSKRNENSLKEMSKLAKNYSKWIDDEMKKSQEEMVFILFYSNLDLKIVSNVGKLDPKKHLTQNIEEVLNTNISQTLGIGINSKAF